MFPIKRDIFVYFYRPAILFVQGYFIIVLRLTMGFSKKN